MLSVRPFCPGFLPPTPLLLRCRTHGGSPPALTSRRRAPAAPTRHTCMSLPATSKQPTAPDNKDTGTGRVDKLWTEQWYAVAIMDDLRPGDLRAIRLFGLSLVLFLDDATGLPTALDDVCPHRAVKLSDGRLVRVDGATRVECAYHGWQFTATGQCAHRPAALPGEPAPESCNVPRYAVETNAMGVIFVFLGDLTTANTMSVPGPSLVGPDVYYLPPFFRRIPVSFAVQMENLVDPAHFPFAHHGTNMGDRDSFTHSRVLRITEFDERSGTIVFAQSSVDGKQLLQGEVSRGGTQLVNRNMPSEALNKGDSASAKKEKEIDVEFTYHLTPTARNETVLFLCGAIAGLPAPAVFLARRQPRWISHCASHIILDGDTHLLQHSEVNLARCGATWRNYVNRNGAQDAVVVKWRSWLEQRERDLPFTDPPEMGTDLPFEVVNDRFRWHGADCLACRGALRNFRAIRLGALFVLAAAAAFTAGAAGAAAWTVASLAGAVVLVAAAVAAVCQRGVEALTVTKRARHLYEA